MFQYPFIQSFVGLFISFVCCVAYLELINKITIYGNPQITRKLTHIGTGFLYSLLLVLLPVDYIYAPLIASLSPISVVLGFCFVAAGPPPNKNWHPRLLKLHSDLVKNMSLSKPPNRMDLLKGPLHYGITVILVTLLFWVRSPAFAIIMGVLLFGDALASVCGKIFGKWKLQIWWKENSDERYEKTWEGFFAFCVASYLSIIFMVWYFKWMGVYASNPFQFSDFAIIAVIPSIFCAFAELLSPPEVDNLIITAAAILSTYVLYVCGYTFLIASQISQFNR